MVWSGAFGTLPVVTTAFAQAGLLPRIPRPGELNDQITEPSTADPGEDTMR